MNLVVADGVAFVWGVGEAVLVAQVFFNFGVDGVDCFFFCDFEHATAGFFGDLLEDFLAIGALLLWRISPTASAAAHSAAVTAHSEPAGAAIALFFVGEQDRVDDRVGALRGGDGFRQSLSAAVIHAV